MLRIVRRKLHVQGNQALCKFRNGVCFFSISHGRTSDESTQQEASSVKIEQEASSGKTLPVPPAPPPLELCCMSGCQNCVMIQHAEEMLRIYDNDTVARAAIEEIPDENLKAFLKIELNLK